jgi:hypothetical protein
MTRMKTTATASSVFSFIYCKCSLLCCILLPGEVQKSARQVFWEGLRHLCIWKALQVILRYRQGWAESPQLLLWFLSLRSCTPVTASMNTAGSFSNTYRIKFKLLNSGYKTQHDKLLPTCPATSPLLFLH